MRDGRAVPSRNAVPSLTRKREGEKWNRAALTLARLREREGPAAKRREGEGLYRRDSVAVNK
jgi:hypothetical protein